MRKISILCSSLFLTVSTAAIAAPENDDFSQATRITGSYKQYETSTIAADIEAGEPQVTYWDTDESIWYTWTCPSLYAGTVSLSLRIYNTDYGFHYLNVFQSGSQGDIFNLTAIHGLGVSHGNLESGRFPAVPGTKYYFRVAAAGRYDPSALQFTFNYTPRYSTRILFLTRPRTLGKTHTISARVGSKHNAASVRVRSTGNGRATNVRYFKNTGKIGFRHNRPRAVNRGNTRFVRYTISSYKGGQRSAIASRRYRLR